MNDAFNFGYALPYSPSQFRPRLETADFLFQILVPELAKFAG